jgi:arabinan endo-1,5-alpha-L-arabinosidase
MQGSRRSLVTAGFLALGFGACHGEADTVAAAYGDYDPARPLVPLSLKGSIEITDPALFRWGDKYWVFSTGTGIAVHSSPDLVSFTAEQPVFTQNPAWIAQTLPEVTDLWSPEVRVFGGRIHLYYAASTYSSGRSCIGHAVATSLDLPFAFEDRGSIICSSLGSTRDSFDAIDPAVLVNAPDEPWLVFGSWGDGIHLLALDANGDRRSDVAMVTLATRPSSNPAIQASFLYRWRDDYYLFVSFDGNPSHSLHVGRSQALAGPYTDRDGNSMLQGGGTLLLSGDSQFTGPGSNSILDDNGDRRLNAYHAYDSNGTAVLRIAPLFFDNDGWPVTAGP